MFFGNGKTLGPPGGPQGPPKGPLEVQKGSVKNLMKYGITIEHKNRRHIGYQFYSVFSTENESRVDIYLRIQIRLPQGGPWGSRGPLGRSPKNLLI